MVQTKPLVPTLEPLVRPLGRNDEQPLLDFQRGRQPSLLSGRQLDQATVGTNFLLTLVVFDQG